MLPLLLDYADDKDPLVQQAALTALRHFGEPAAIEKLLHYLRKGVEPLATTAIESLASSRYAAAHDALLDVLDNGDSRIEADDCRRIGALPASDLVGNHL